MLGPQVLPDEQAVVIRSRLGHRARGRQCVGPGGQITCPLVAVQPDVGGGPTAGSAECPSCTTFSWMARTDRG